MYRLKPLAYALAFWAVIVIIVLTLKSNAPICLSQGPCIGDGLGIDNLFSILLGS